MDELEGQDCRNNRGDAETNKAELNGVSIAGSYISESGVVNSRITLQPPISTGGSSD